ncbi:hypothetical protein V5F38_05355 [Xanthobacter sp. V0B-10]|uniref:hypothetical protein n=1 Tax=Xanthobacter albus TaxID=3119929 RepID=UPI003728284D
MTTDTDKTAQERERFEAWEWMAPSDPVQHDVSVAAAWAAWQARAALDTGAIPPGWKLSVRESDGRTWLRIQAPGRSEACLSAITLDRNGHKTIVAQVLDLLAKDLAAPQPPASASAGKVEPVADPEWLARAAVSIADMVAEWNLGPSPADGPPADLIARRLARFAPPAHPDDFERGAADREMTLRLRIDQIVAHAHTIIELARQGALPLPKKEG